MLPKLLIKCEACNGECYVRSPEWERWDALFEQKRSERRARGLPISHVDILEQMPPMPEDVPEEEPCIECGGTGQVPTQAGEQILKLINWKEARLDI
jgi:ferredoxin